MAASPTAGSEARFETPAANRAAPPPPPVAVKPPLADPSIEVTDAGLVAVSTGTWVPRATAPGPGGPWTTAPTGLAMLPTWATGPEIWAADIVRIDRRWLLYFSAPVAGLGRQGRCIGVAVSDSPTGNFTPLEDRPLVCPRRAKAPRAYDDTVPEPGEPDHPRAGAIDPSVFGDKAGKQYLLYKTQGRPATLRMVPLTKRGTRVSRIRGEPRPSTELMRSRKIIENPVLVRRRSEYVLFYSQGNFRNCHYKTLWRRAGTPTKLAKAPKHALLNRSRTGVCGPGGADIARIGGSTQMFFHGWVCRTGPGSADFTACHSHFHVERDSDLDPRRVLYAARLSWTSTQRPRVRFFHVPAGG